MKKGLRNQLVEEILRARERIYHVNKPTPFERVRIDDPHGDARERPAYGSSTRCRLEKTGGPEIGAIHGNDRRAFRDAITLDRADAKPVFEGLAETGGKLLGSGQHHAQAAELFGAAAPLVELEEGRCADQKRQTMFGAEFSDGSHVERGWVKDGRGKMDLRALKRIAMERLGGGA